MTELMYDTSSVLKANKAKSYSGQTPQHQQKKPFGQKPVIESILIELH
jgi:hypothetical protein